MTSLLLRAAVLGVVLAAASGCSPIVGASCVPGAIVCDGRCVDPLTDPLACGGCDIACGLGESCMAGACVGGDASVPDGGVPDGAVPDGAVPDGGVPDGGDAGVPGDAGDAGPFDGGMGDGGGLDAGDAGPLDGGMGDGGGLDAGDGGMRDGGTGDGGTGDGGMGDAGAPPICDLGTVACVDRCVDVASDPMNCGGCDLRCGTGELCAAGSCVRTCEPPTVACGGACIDIQSDPNHCGGCGIVCPTGLCSMGMCRSAVAGHLVVIGHDYVERRPAMDRLIANAVLLSPASPVRVLSYEGEASAASVTGAEAAVMRVATALGRTLTFTAAEEQLVSGQLADHDVFLIHAQAGSTLALLEALGTQWSLAMSTFLERGGIVVVLDTLAPHGGTWQLLQAAGLMIGERIEDATLTTARVVAPGDGVAIGVPLTYRAEATSVRFIGTDLPIVVRDTAAPLVLHVTVSRPDPGP